ncbi:MAG: branched-chain amino acid ABC transporter permease [Actinobacteria bacterium]|nr:branched-chain amino acid ABC transporter permease [Actinomycetota bacterium]
MSATSVLLAQQGIGSELMSVIIIGLRIGAVYALIALGLALIYKATRVFNFAHGEFGTVPMFVTWGLVTGGLGMTMWAAAGIAIVVGVLLAVATYFLVVRWLRARPGVTTLVATAGVALFLIQLQIIIGRAEPRNFPPFIDGSPCITRGEDGSCFWRVGGVIIEWQTILIVGVLAAVAVILALFFRTRTGTALLATAQEPFAASLYGISTERMAVITWAAAGGLAAIGGVLAGAFDQLFTPGWITGRYLVAAFTAAILGGITSMPGVVVGGVLLGMIQAASGTWLPATWPGRPQIGVFTILVLVLVLRPRGLLGKEA